MERDRDKMAERIITLTLHILFLLTGEDYTVVKKSSSGRRGATGCEAWGRTLSPIPGPLIHEEMEEEKILEVTNKMVELLSGEGEDGNNINAPETVVSSGEQYKEEITTGEDLNHKIAMDKVVKEEGEETDDSGDEQYKEDITTEKDRNSVNATDITSEEETDDSSDEQYKGDIPMGKHLNSMNATDIWVKEEEEETDDSSDEQYKEDITTASTETDRNSRLTDFMDGKTWFTPMGKKSRQSGFAVNSGFFTEEIFKCKSIQTKP
ncbi:gastrula zinc finger protein XlCGF48.2-like [Dendropsophus ebraccatus]|uniref:gastrula zinc finger protein XlCGF48.2-like n=1 Tax=Dendropsophus ebraccatus TaxID=150705 RepID=UPI0038310E42